MLDYSAQGGDMFSKKLQNVLGKKKPVTFRLPAKQEAKMCEHLSLISLQKRLFHDLFFLEAAELTL